MNANRQTSGRLGGLQTFLKHGSGYMSQIGKRGGLLGGRPRSLSLEECRQLQALNNKKGGKLPQGESLEALKELWQLRLQSRGETKISLPG